MQLRKDVYFLGTCILTSEEPCNSCISLFIGSYPAHIVLIGFDIKIFFSYASDNPLPFVIIPSASFHISILFLFIFVNVCSTDDYKFSSNLLLI